jgi:hypothetical protein
MSRKYDSELVCGYGITAQRARLDKEPPMVVMHRLGSDERTYLTPAEARVLAMVLSAAADCATKESP